MSWELYNPEKRAYKDEPVRIYHSNFKNKGPIHEDLNQGIHLYILIEKVPRYGDLWRAYKDISFRDWIKFDNFQGILTGNDYSHVNDTSQGRIIHSEGNFSLREL